MTTTAETTNNMSNGDAGVVAASALNGHVAEQVGADNVPTTATSPDSSNQAEGGLNRGWSFPNKSAAGHAPVRSSPLAAKGEPTVAEAAPSGVGVSPPGQSPATAATIAADKVIQRASSPLDQLLAKRAAAAAGRPMNAHRRAESLSSAGGPPPGLSNMPMPTARPRFRASHGRSTSLSLPGGGIAGLGSSSLASTLTRQPHGPTPEGSVHAPAVSKPRSGTFQREAGGSVGFQPGHLTSASLSHTFGSSVLTSGWGKEGSGTHHPHHHHSHSHHFGHQRMSSVGSSTSGRNVDELVDRDIGDGMLSNVVHTLDSLGLREEGAAAAAASTNASVGLGVRPLSHRTRSRSLLGGSAATNAAVLGDVSPSTGAPLHRPSGVSHFLKTHSRPRAISLDYFNPADLEREADLLAESYRSSQQGSPTEATFSLEYDETGAGERQIPTRSLWIGNVPAHVTSTDLMQIFSAYGPIESLRVLPDRDCAFVNFQQVEDSSRAHEDMRGARLGGSLIRVGFGKADVYGTDMQGMQPTRALWIGNISPQTTSQLLQQVFTPFGAIESVRVLTHKNCGFVNFERTEDAKRAKNVMNGQEIAGAIVRIGFAKVPALEASVGSAADPVNGVRGKEGEGNQAHVVNTNFSFPPGRGKSGDGYSDDLQLQSEGFDGHLLELDADVCAFAYASALPSLPPVNPHRRMDAPRLRDIRKRLDAHPTAKELEAAFNELYPESVELSFDYIGNTVIQKVAEYGTESQKLRLLEKVAPHFASIGVHKNGTWAVQKMIDTASTPEQIETICIAIKPFVPALMLDQFGNYVVQCCLRFGPKYNQFIFEAMHARCLEIAQGRFGARAMRTCLENQYISVDQQKFVGVAAAMHAPQLITNTNGTLLLTWLLDTSNLPGRYRVLAPRLVPQLATLGVHKLASATILKVTVQDVDREARDIMLNGLFGAVGDEADEDHTLEIILEDQAHGVNLVHKIFTGIRVDDAKKLHIARRIRLALGRVPGHLSAAHRRLADDVTALLGPVVTNSIGAVSATPTAGMPTFVPEGSAAVPDPNTAQLLLNAFLAAASNGGAPPADDATMQQQFALLNMMGLNPQTIQANAAYMMEQNPALAALLQQQQPQQVKTQPSLSQQPSAPTTPPQSNPENTQ